jgi:SAM-dependent methyltransferase
MRQANSIAPSPILTSLRSARGTYPAETADRKSSGISETCGQPDGSIGRPAIASPSDHLLRTADEARVTAAYARRNKSVPADLYSLSNPGNLLLVQDRERQVLRLLGKLGCFPLASKAILEIGCGTGYWLRDFIKWGARPAQLTGIDLLPDRLAEARQLCPAGVQLTCGSAAAVPAPDASFDLVLQATVFTSVLDAAFRQQIAGEMLRLVKPGGAILWYDFRVNNPNNPDVRRVGRAEIRRLFPGCRVELRPITLAPPLARRLAGYSRWMCELLQACPLLCTHYLGAIRREEG